MKIKNIIPHLWYDKEAIEAAEYYVSIFPDSKIINIATFDAYNGGTCDVVEFELSGNPFMAINAGPLFKFNESVSFMVHCENQEEIDYYWDKLKDGGEEQACGWLKDKFGLSWQIVPSDMNKIMHGDDKEKLSRVIQEVYKMVKFDLEKISKASN